MWEREKRERSSIDLTSMWPFCKLWSHVDSLLAHAHTPSHILTQACGYIQEACTQHAVVISYFTHILSATSTWGSHRIVDKLFVNTRYFVMKSNNHENIDLAKDKVSVRRWAV